MQPAPDRVAVVTDSTAYLPAQLCRQHAITVVPLHVILGSRTGREGLDVSPAEVAAALAERRVKVSTSRPTPAELASAYRACRTSRIVSVHLSGDLSGTLDAARAAAADVAADGIEVDVVDSRSVVMGLGVVVLRAARAASTGASLATVVAAARPGGDTTLFYVDTLDHLRRGGRIGAAAALVGAALLVKPLLHVRDGRIAPLEKVRTAARAIARLEELAVQAALQAPAPSAGTPGRLDQIDVAVHHLAAPDTGAALADRLRARLPGLASLQLCEVGAVVGAHVGPGLLGVVVARR